ncbi:homoserine O-acetyltransferase/O-succinyltransferase family protein [Fructilactobacillus frigidiflavus]|uniref:homoserine O-acetyltransferase/O-succinyltransferase family protein n=1 Tax=Fructilactobacillus frigidiflavus TaxID=3242688 RepID=UPI003757D0C8
MGCMNILSGYSKNHHQPQLDAINLLVLNLMPNRAETEHQIISLLKCTPHNFNVTFCRMATHHTKHFASEIIDKYVTLADIEDQNFDALLVTGAPVDQKKFAEIDYWEEFKHFIDWRKDHVGTSLFTCWAAWAAGTLDDVLIGQPVTNKIYGVYTTNGITMPHSRYFKVPVDYVNATVLAGNSQIGATLIWDDTLRSAYVTGHFEYGTNTLAQEYFRDLNNGLHTKKPVNYFDENQRPHNTWKRSGSQFINQWLTKIATPIQS